MNSPYECEKIFIAIKENIYKREFVKFFKIENICFSLFFYNRPIVEHKLLLCVIHIQ